MAVAFFLSPSPLLAVAFLLAPEPAPEPSDPDAGKRIEALLPLELSLAWAYGAEGGAPADQPPQSAPPPAQAGGPPPQPAPTAPPGEAFSLHGPSIKGGLGFTLNPTDFLMVLQFDYFFARTFSVGPLLQFAVDDRFIFAPTLNFQAAFNLPGVDRLEPFVQGGLGLAYMTKGSGSDFEDDTGFLFNFGGGVEFFVLNNLSVGSDILFNIMPDEVLDKRFFFSWQLVTFRFQF